jgi:hypothetical protein
MGPEPAERITAPVIVAALPASDVFACRNLETGEEAIVVSARLKRPANWRWSWSKRVFVFDQPAYGHERWLTKRRTD